MPAGAVQRMSSRNNISRGMPRHPGPTTYLPEDDMSDLFDNPMQLMGFEFVEFASPTPNVLEPLFEQMGFTLVARHRSKDVVLYRQGDVNFIVNREPHSLAAYFAAEHGPSACGMAFRVKDSHKAYARALELGAQPVEIPTGPMERHRCGRGRLWPCS